MRLLMRCWKLSWARTRDALGRIRTSSSSFRPATTSAWSRSVMPVRMLQRRGRPAAQGEDHVVAAELPLHGRTAALSGVLPRHGLPAVRHREDRRARASAGCTWAMSFSSSSVSSSPLRRFMKIARMRSRSNAGAAAAAAAPPRAVVRGRNVRCRGQHAVDGFAVEVRGRCLRRRCPLVCAARRWGRSARSSRRAMTTLDFGVHAGLQEAFAVLQIDQHREHGHVLLRHGLRLDLDDLALGTAGWRRPRR